MNINEIWDDCLKSMKQQEMVVNYVQVRQHGEKILDWGRMEQFLEKMSENEEIWYATNIEIYEYVSAAGQLQYSATGQYIFNPTLRDIWMMIDGMKVELPSGKVTEL